MKRLLTGVALAALALGMTVGSSFAAGTLYFGISGEPTTMDPMMQTGTTFRTVKLGLHRGLLNYGNDGKLSNELAESYEIAPDAQSITFHLRDAKFHDGTTVTGNDVKASLERIIAPDSPASFRNELSIISAIDVVDDKTVKLTLSRPSGSKPSTPIRTSPRWAPVPSSSSAGRAARKSSPSASRTTTRKASPTWTACTTLSTATRIPV